jgi:predicted metal-dependent phosphoesterase TrpH
MERRVQALSPSSATLADLHLHTNRSDGAMAVAPLLAHVHRRTPLAIVAITDHDELAAAVEAWTRVRDLPPGSGPRVIVGSEVTASWGRHLVALFPRPPFPARPLPRYRSLLETTARIRDLGGLVIVPHPATPLVPSLSESDVRCLSDAGLPVDGIEVCTGSIGGRRREGRMRTLAREVGAATIGSSDAHHLAHVGKAVTVVPAGDGDVVERVVEAIRSREIGAAWGVAGRIGPRSVLAQAGRAWALNPARELGAAMQAILARRRWRLGFRPR